MFLKECREARCKTQADLAREINVTVGYISLLENGKRKNPSMDVILRLADSLGVSVEQLLRGKKAG